MILAIDPGPTVSGIVVACDDSRFPIPRFSRVEPNDRVMRLAGDRSIDTVVVEQVQNYGKSVGASTFDTVFETGRMVQHFLAASKADVWRMPRRHVKLEVAGRSNTDDSAIRRAIIDSYGGEIVAVGGRKCKSCCGRKSAMASCVACNGTGMMSPKGVLWGVASHSWQALAMCIAFCRLRARGERGFAQQIERGSER